MRFSPRSSRGRPRRRKEASAVSKAKTCRQVGRRCNVAQFQLVWTVSAGLQASLSGQVDQRCTALQRQKLVNMLSSCNFPFLQWILFPFLLKQTFTLSHFSLVCYFHKHILSKHTQLKPCDYMFIICLTGTNEQDQSVFAFLNGPYIQCRHHSLHYLSLIDLLESLFCH